MSEDHKLLNFFCLKRVNKKYEEIRNKTKLIKLRIIFNLKFYNDFLLR
jgi:hypothetical protein